MKNMLFFLSLTLLGSLSVTSMTRKYRVNAATLAAGAGLSRGQDMLAQRMGSDFRARVIGTLVFEAINGVIAQCYAGAERIAHAMNLGYYSERV